LAGRGLLNFFFLSGKGSFKKVIDKNKSPFYILTFLFHFSSVKIKEGQTFEKSAVLYGFSFGDFY